jgi:hypothetical protein
MNTAAMFIDAVSKHLLALVVDHINVVEHYYLSLPFDGTARLTEYLQVISIILNTLLL